MPSPVCRAGRGLTAVTFERGASAAARKELKQFFGRVGRVLEIPESTFDAFTATYSSSHGYRALAALAEAAQKLGLDRRLPLRPRPRAGGRDYLLARGEHLTGCPAAGGSHPRWNRRHRDETMEEAGYRGIVERGLRAGVARARKNVKGETVAQNSAARRNRRITR